MIEFTLGAVAAKVRAEDSIKQLTDRPEDDEAFHTLCVAAYDEDIAEDAMYYRLLYRGFKS